MNSTKPAFIELLETSLECIKYRTFSKIVENYEDGLRLTVVEQRTPDKYLEGVAAAVIKDTDESVARCFFEPNGSRSFPDISADFNDGSSIKFEVKSWSSDYCGWAAASINKFRKAIQEEDFRYFEAWYIDFSIVERIDASYLIDEVRLGKIWDFANGLRITGSNPSYKAGLGTTPLAFAINTSWNETSLRTMVRFLSSQGHVSMDEPELDLLCAKIYKK